MENSWGWGRPRETKVQALTREILEETSIDITTCQIHLINDSMTGEAEKVLRDSGERVLAKMNFSTYKVNLDKLASEIPIALDAYEFNEYKWVELSELKNLKLSPPSIELFTLLGLL